MKLYNLRLKNFKGIQSAEFGFDGSNMSIYGDNGTGKTTIMDAPQWLLFGKDSLNSANFEVKTRIDGEVQHGLEHEVEATFDLNGEPLTLMKRLTEKWTKRRGSAEKEFTGHSIDHFVDGVPVSERDYKARIASIADEQTFRLLTNPRYFSEGLKWQERRKILLDVCGDITDSDVIASDDKLSTLPDILGKRAMEDHKKVISSRRAEINKQLEQVPVRISEQQSALVDTSKLDPKTIRSFIGQLQFRQGEKRSELSRIRTGGEIAEKTKHLREIESKLLKLENDESREITKIASERSEKRKKLAMEIDAAERLQRQANTRFQDIGTEIDKFRKIIETLRQTWREVDATQFAFEQSSVCPTCGQDLPAEQLDAARQKALEDFNQRKASKLAAITADGKAITERIAKLETEAEELLKKAEELEKVITPLRAKLAEPEEAIVIAEAPGKATLVSEIATLNSTISELRIGSHDIEAECQAEIDSFDADISAQQKLLASIDAAETAKERIDELKRSERKLSAELEKLEGELFLCEEFTRRKVSMLEENINTKFQIARFKLFEPQINGGLSECCEITVDGVPYWSVNNSARINAGLDVCNTLSHRFNFTAPTFIDNAESVNELISTESQQIRLIVSRDKELRFEPVNQ